MGEAVWLAAASDTEGRRCGGGRAPRAAVGTIFIV